jgi:ribosome-associated toxin RatA of RatAB toxin-antitoxin module
MQLTRAMKQFLVVAVPLFLIFPQGCSTKYTIKAPDYRGYKGEINQHSRLIKADASLIFRILTQEELYKKICPPGTIVTYEPPLPYQVGTIVRTNIEHIFKLEWKSRVEEVIPDSTIRLQFLNGFFAGGNEFWEIEDEGDHTRVSQTIVVQPKGVIRNIFWSLKVRLKHNIMVEEFLDNLKDIAESNSE